MSYYQHPALRGCHSFSLELASNTNNRNQTSRLNETNQYSRNNATGKSPTDSGTSSDVEMMIDNIDDCDREIDLSIKPDSNHTRSSSMDEEEKISPSLDNENSFESSESIEPLKGKNDIGHLNFCKTIARVGVFVWRDLIVPLIKFIYFHLC